MPRRRKVEGPFEAELRRHNELASAPPVGRTALLGSLDRLENTGRKLMGEGVLEPVAYAKKMQAILGAVLELEVQPPLDEGQIANIRGVLTFCKALLPSAQIPSGPSDPTALPTAARKA